MKTKNKSRKRKQSLKNALSWSWEFTKLIVTILTIVYFLIMIYCGVVIWMGMYKLAITTYLDTFITEINETFRLIVGANVIKAGVENVFKYNDFGGKGELYNNGKSSINNESESLYTSEDRISDGLQ